MTQSLVFSHERHLFLARKGGPINHIDCGSLVGSSAADEGVKIGWSGDAGGYLAETGNGAATSAYFGTDPSLRRLTEREKRGPVGGLNVPTGIAVLP